MRTRSWHLSRAIKQQHPPPRPPPITAFHPQLYLGLYVAQQPVSSYAFIALQAPHPFAWQYEDFSPCPNECGPLQQRLTREVACVDLRTQLPVGHHHCWSTGERGPASELFCAPSPPCQGSLRQVLWSSKGEWQVFRQNVSAAAALFVVKTRGRPDQTTTQTEETTEQNTKMTNRKT